MAFSDSDLKIQIPAVDLRPPHVRLLLARLLSSRLSGAISFPAGNLHDVPGALFECGIAPLRTISALTRDFHFRRQPYNSTSCSDRKMSQENTQKEQNREKKSIFTVLSVSA